MFAWISTIITSISAIAGGLFLVVEEDELPLFASGRIEYCGNEKKSLKGCGDVFGRLTISNWYLTMVLSLISQLPPTSTPPTIEESLAKLVDIIDKLELVAKRLTASTTNLVSLTPQTTFTTNESNDHIANTKTDITETTTEVKDKQEKDKIGLKPDKNEKRGEAEKSQKQL
uniref:Uncharacterized protein n=1 Tax=Tanacetum cinerariifolium TaxID=118510 RepID=A0A6L2NPA6_TANCI|nr:hypothetical protein [Tanacetum cinerariifolium]